MSDDDEVEAYRRASLRRKARRTTSTTSPTEPEEAKPRRCSPRSAALNGDALYDDADNELFDQAVAIVTQDRKASTSYHAAARLKIGYNRAARIIEQMEKEGVVSPANRVGRREVLVGSH